MRIPLVIPSTLVLAATAEGLVRTLGPGGYDWKAYWAALANALVRGLLRLIPLGLASSLLGVLWEHRLFSIPMHSAGSLVALFLAVDLGYYAFHRASHTVRWFWASHAVHHAPNSLGLSVAYQLGVTGAAGSAALFYAPLAWVGFPPRAVLGMLVLNLVYQFWLHAPWIPRLGWLEWWLNTPSHHRVHHASNEAYRGRVGLGANFGGVLILFDRLFGTCVEERAALPCRYGLTPPLLSYNPLYIACHEWLAMARDIGAARTWRSRFLYAFGRPGWKPLSEMSHSRPRRAPRTGWTG
jgi:sterol desaturase/sphingolipid hydroxylase (fatty acid hydroxylase superfamily)